MLPNDTSVDPKYGETLEMAGWILANSQRALPDNMQHSMNGDPSERGPYGSPLPTRLLNN